MPFVIPGCREEPPLRANGKMVHLTYAALYRDELNHDFLLATAREWASTRQGLCEYAIGCELHPEPAEPDKDEHFHVYVKFGKKIDVPDRLHTTNASTCAGVLGACCILSSKP